MNRALGKMRIGRTFILPEAVGFETPCFGRPALGWLGSVGTPRRTDV